MRIREGSEEEQERNSVPSSEPQSICATKVVAFLLCKIFLTFDNKK